MSRNSIETEKRNKSISLSVTPSFLEGVKNLAKSRGVSVNSLIIAVMSEVMRKNAKTTENFMKAHAEFEKAKRAARNAELSNVDVMTIDIAAAD